VCLLPLKQLQSAMPSQAAKVSLLLQRMTPKELMQYLLALRCWLYSPGFEINSKAQVQDC